MNNELYVDQQVCIGCGLCVSLVPEVFRLNGDGVSEVYQREAGEDARVQQAVDSCPVNCIHWR